MLAPAIPPPMMATSTDSKPSPRSFARPFRRWRRPDTVHWYLSGVYGDRSSDGERSSTTTGKEIVSDPLFDLFAGLVALPTPPGHERACANLATEYLVALGLRVQEDDAGTALGGDAGNLYCHVPPTMASGLPPGSVNSPIKRTGDWRSPGKTQVRPRSVIGTAVPVPGHATASRRPPVREFTGRDFTLAAPAPKMYTDYGGTIGLGFCPVVVFLSLSS